MKRVITGSIGIILIGALAASFGWQKIVCRGASVSTIRHLAIAEGYTPPRDLPSVSAWRGVQASTEMRKRFLGIKPEEVRCIRVGIYYRDGTESGEITDRRVIRMMLEGLQEAVAPDNGPKDFGSSVAVILRSGRRVGPFSFQTQREIYAFSPKFVAGLRAAGVTIPWPPEKPVSPLRLKIMRAKRTLSRWFSRQP